MTESSLRCAALLLAILVIILLGFSVLTWKGSAFASRQVRSVLAMLDLRSPGTRNVGNLIDTKPALANSKPTQRTLGKVFRPPNERALGKIFAPPENLMPVGAEAPFTPPFQPDGLGIAGLPNSLPAGLTGGGGGGIGGGGGGVGGGGGSAGGTIPPGIPVAAIPEPDTWLLMIVAFGLCGFVLRRQARPHPNGSSCNPAI